MLAGRRVWTGLLALVLLLGAIDLHPSGETFDSLAHLQGELYSSTARHPNQPAHFEESCDAQRPACPVCLHQLRTGGAHLLATVGLETPSLQIFGVSAAPLLAGGARLGPSGARAPPLV